MGSIFSMIPWAVKAKKGEGDQTNLGVRLIREAAAVNGIYDSNKIKAVISTFMSTPVIAITDPAMAQELFTTKNKLIDKNEAT